MAADKLDPIVKLGDRHRRFRIRFWEYFRPELLDALVQAIAAGDCAGVTALEGEGRTMTGEWLSFAWDKRDGVLTYSPAPASPTHAGQVIFHGRLDYWTINLLRNFPIFHLRSKLDLGPQPPQSRRRKKP